MKEDNPELISYHCIIHQSVLCSTLSDEYAEVMNTMMRMINFLRASSSHQHRMLREFLSEVDANADDLLLHNNRKLELFKEDLQGDCAHFPTVQEQVQDVALKEHFGGTDPATFWLQMVSETAFPGLRKVALYILTMFGSTYSCEAAFSTMNIIKTKYRSRLTNEHLHMCMRMVLTPFQPRFKILAGQARAQFCH
ncbi:hypothetical protein AAFF_G00097380 [Aldrovandia affinis]|uniref:HAT C-terminal dimerisation domain-containing protein n=1 Tax=Aldrovandia affinis TaxID=143900 RepID=A0AAD7RVN8_9TELE|nr:hypothetical protein AAFF_G00097380 [Aldrovandia affinis]